MYSDKAVIGNEVCKVKRADVLTTAGGTVSIVGAVTGKKIRVVAAALTISAPGSFSLDGDTTNSTAGVAILINTGGPVMIPAMPGGIYETAADEALIGQATIGAVAGYINYVEV